LSISVWRACWAALASAAVFWVSSLVIALSTDFRAARFSFSWAFRSAMPAWMLASSSLSWSFSAFFAAMADAKSTAAPFGTLTLFLLPLGLGMEIFLL